MAQKKQVKKINNKKTITNKKVKKKSVSNKTAFKTTKKVKKVAKPIKKKEIVKTKNKKNVTPAKKATTTKKKNGEKIIASQKKNNSKTEPIKKKEIAPVVATTTDVDKKEDVKKELVLVKPYKRPSRLNYFWIVPLLLLFIVSIALPAGFYFAVIHDPRTKEVTATGNLNINNAMTRLFANSITNINVPDSSNESKHYGHMLFDINEKSLDEVAMVVRNKIVEKDAELANFIPKMYFTINENKYNLYADINIADKLVTRIGLMTTLTEEEGTEQDPIVKFQIDGISLGRFRVPDFLKNIITRFVNPTTLNQAFNNIGISAQFNNDLSIVYKRSDFVNDIKKFAQKSLGDNNILATIFTDLIQNNLDFDPYGSVSFSINLSDMHQHDTYRREHPEMIPTTALDIYRNKILSLLEKGVISTANEANNVFAFLQHGYYVPDDNPYKHALNEYYYKRIENIDLSEIGIPDKKAYIIADGADELHKDVIFSLKDSIMSGLPSTEEEKTEFINKITNFISPTSTEKTLTLTTIPSVDFYNFAKSLTLIGNTTFFITPTIDNKHIANYITINNADFVFTKEGGNSAMRMFVNLNVNGYTLEAIINMTPNFISEGDIKKVQCKMDKMYLGKKELEESTKIALINFINSGNNISPSGDSAFYINVPNNSLDINLSEVYSTLINYIPQAAIKERVKKFIDDNCKLALEVDNTNTKLNFNINKNN